MGIDGRKCMKNDAMAHRIRSIYGLPINKERFAFNNRKREMLSNFTGFPVGNKKLAVLCVLSFIYCRKIVRRMYCATSSRTGISLTGNYCIMQFEYFDL